MAAPKNPVETTANLMKTAVDTASDTSNAALKGVAIGAVTAIQGVRSLLDSVESLAEFGIDIAADTIDDVLAKLQAYVHDSASGGGDS